MEKVKKNFLVKIIAKIWLAEIDRNNQQEMYWEPKTSISEGLLRNKAKC